MKPQNKSGLPLTSNIKFHTTRLGHAQIHFETLCTATMSMF